MLTIEKIADDRLRLSGRLDVNTIQDLESVLNQVENNLTIDIAAIEYINSAGLGVLLGTYQRLKKQNKMLQLLHPTPYIKELFSITGLDLLLVIES